ncbi:hypothetical protein PHSY_002085 [Pseudozyma hubeiensis SY62]|uniref:Uncharacterized protein n=1 Tax=Pseudozyma hubeiensis (strain SY62) TaxID=1305764 RepID=R9P008_PSEHS|nr:hypothetical protein PHSY_002085 [Pseudozyma hubeiensis SY62]GAC94513.1 hypothetical protein PHSY_002085 [Pseudozyma hubeiensis SY62]
MGNITSRQATNLIDSFVLRLARIIDSTLRRLNRSLSTFSSFFFSKLFGYDVVIVDDACANSVELTRKDSLVCGPGNVCIVPASRIQHRQLEKKRRSERRRRAEAAALGEKMLRKHGYSVVDSVPSSPTSDREKVRVSLGEVARAPAARSEKERETVGERERGKLWVMGNVAASSRSSDAKKSPTIPNSPTGIDEMVLQRVQDQRSNIASNSTVIKRRIQPRKSSRPPLPPPPSQHHLPSAEIDPKSAPTSIASVAETDESPSGGRASKPSAALPPGALSLRPSPWEPTFRHPFSAAHEPLPSPTATTIQPQPRQPSRPKLSLDTTLPAASTTAPASSSTSSPHRPSLARRSIDTLSLRHNSLDAPPAIDVKSLATKAVRESKGRAVWKDHVHKAAMHKCLQQQTPAAAAGGRRFSTATLGPGGPLMRVKTSETDLLSADAVAQRARRGSSPSLASGRSTHVVREASPLHDVGG